VSLPLVSCLSVPSLEVVGSSEASMSDVFSCFLASSVASLVFLFYLPEEVADPSLLILLTGSNK
ncbi:hypothetical protein, partial [Borrelia sp. A-FGy1]|uniref:hypothetical protein n=1 Tax=Borrelia sp. A-FGy1 TaxID=2608247 RepID=UPI0015F58C5A